jgi:2-(3-amino-3-carboxypropyl)histidine synthase
MEISGYLVDIDYAVTRLRESRARKVLVQAPLGLKGVARKVCEKLEGEGFEVLISSSSCWGGCDVAYGEAAETGADAILHLGHTPFLRRDRIPTIYLECGYADDQPLRALAEKIAGAVGGFSKVGLGASVQWVNHLQTVMEILGGMGVDVVLAEPDMYAVHRAQVLGCDVSALKKIENRVEAYLVIGSVFHGLGIALLSEKPAYAADPHNQSVKELKTLRDRILRQRYASIEAFRKARDIGVVVSLKPGQKRMGLAMRLNNLLRKHGKNSFIVTGDEITPAVLEENRFDAYVNTACPRLCIEDQARFSKPMLLPAESLVALGLLDWAEMLERGLLMYPWGWADNSGEVFWKQLRVEEVVA